MSYTTADGDRTDAEKIIRCRLHKFAGKKRVFLTLISLKREGLGQDMNFIFDGLVGVLAETTDFLEATG